MSASPWKVQRIRSCVQCGDVLGLKCKRCVAHPDRKPRTVEYFNWPPILKTGPCGCILIACQAAGCVKTMWRETKHSRAGLSQSKKLYCSNLCVTRTNTAARMTRAEVPCSYCQKKVMKKGYALKNWAASYCNPTCYFLHRKKKQHEARQAAKRDDASRALLYCEGRCKTVTEHAMEKKGPATCQACGSRRGYDSVGLPQGESQALKWATQEAGR